MFGGTDMVGCDLFPVAVARLRLPDVSRGKTKHSRHAADTAIPRF